MRKAIPISDTREEKGSETRHSEVISFRVTSELKADLQSGAMQEGMSVGEYVRMIFEEWKRQGCQLEQGEGEPRDIVEAVRIAEFEERVAASARGLARGWVKAKLTPAMKKMAKLFKEEREEP